MYEIEKKFSSPSERRENKSLQKNSSRCKISSLTKQIKGSPKDILPAIFKEMADQNSLTYQYVQTQYQLEAQGEKNTNTFHKQSTSKNQQEEQLLKLCQVFELKLQQVRLQKYNLAVNSYARQRQVKKEKQFQIQVDIIQQDYKQKVQNIKKQVLLAQGKLAKSIEDIKKRKQVYELILKQLQEKRENIEGDYNLSKVKAQRFLDSLKKDWDAQKYISTALRDFYSSKR